MTLVPETTRARARTRVGVHAEDPNYKWWALSCTSLGMLLATINSGTLIIALPDLERSLGTSLLELVWVILVYMIASTVLVLTAGRLADLFGRKKAYVGGFLAFALASLGAGFAGSGTELILWRILQGIGGAFLFANSAAIVTDAFPRRQLGLAMGTNTMVAAVGLLVQRAARHRGQHLGGADPARAGEPRPRAAARPARHQRVRPGPDRPRARHLEGRAVRLDQPHRDRQPDSGRGAAPAVRVHRV